MSPHPDELVQQFRAIALERIERIEAAWAQVLARLDDDASTLIQREIHTLKGESRVVGFTDVNMVCHKLEDLLDVARARGYAIEEELDLLVGMALRFMTMLVRKRVGSAMSSIDLPGFIRQIDQVLSRNERTRARPSSVPPLLRSSTMSRVPRMIRDTVGPPAVDAFIEYAVSKGPRRDRLRTSWHTLRDLVGIQRAVISSAQLGKYQASVMSLAHELGKRVELSFDLATAEVTTEIFSALDVATLHLLRNALDHGIETPDLREGNGKRATGTIRVRGGMRGDSFVLSVDDDGAGIDFAAVRARAIELGLLDEHAPAERSRLVELMCHPGFTTRYETSDVSGRGVGMDIVRGSAVDLGGTVTAESERGRGTTWTVSIPILPIVIPGLAIRAPGLRFPVVIDAGWALVPQPQLPVVIDLCVVLGLSASHSISSSVWTFGNGTLELGFLCGGKPTPVSARRLVATERPALAEVITVDAVEGLWIRPDCIPGVAPPPAG